ncbi:hypothetical protein ACFV3R_34325 [Streptomyces sp. NPDC059740]|uniref:hypothetical protein n=1 Tax=Streptomyces sp. NPDC059740 TaxID=3346926 RepID=UPI00366858C3
MVEQGEGLLRTAVERAARVQEAIDALPGLSVMGEEVVRPGAAADLDPLKLSIDVRGFGISGMQAAEWLRTYCHVDVGAADTCRINAQLTHADDDATEAVLLDAVRRLTQEAETSRGLPR